MPEMWEQGPEPGAFALPGDAERYGVPDETATETDAAPETAEETAATEQRGRDEKGRFAAKPDDDEAADEQADDGLIGGKFKTQEDLLKSYQELERQRGLDSAEKAELRQIAERFQQLQTQMDELPGRMQPPPQYDYDSLIETDPAMAAQLAYQSGDQLRFQQAFAAWNDVSPGTPQVWAQNMQLQEKIAELEGSFEQRIAPVQDQARATVTAQALSQFASTHPDFDLYRDQMQQIAVDSPHLAALVNSDDPQAKVEMLDYLYTKAKMDEARGSADNLQDALRNAAQDTARAEQEAAVVSTSQRTAEPEPEGVAEKFGAFVAARNKPYEDGWNI